jgi:Transposase IS116/IS110/IS902 family
MTTHVGKPEPATGRTLARARSIDKPPPFRKLRDLTRYRADLVAARRAEKNRAEKLLEDAQIKLSVVVSDIFGASGRDMLAALVAGERNPKVLAQLARRTMRKKITVLEEASTGYFTDHHAFLLGRMLARVDAITGDITALDERIEAEIAPFAAAVRKLDEVPGISLAAAHAIIAEIGLDMTRFPTAGHLVSWAKYAPGVKESAARRKARTPPATATPTWPGSWVTPRRPPPGPTPSSASVIGGSPAAAAPKKPTWPSAGRSWSSSGTCCPIPKPATPPSAPGSTLPALTPSGAAITTFASSKHSVTWSSSNAPPDPATSIPTGSAGAAACPVTARFSD